MKLRTELHEGRLGFFDIEAVKRDAMAAHALTMALSDVKQQDNLLTANDALWYVEKRAAFLMAGWGLGED